MYWYKLVNFGGVEFWSMEVIIDDWYVKGLWFTHALWLWFYSFWHFGISLCPTHAFLCCGASPKDFRSIHFFVICHSMFSIQIIYYYYYYYFFLILSFSSFCIMPWYDSHKFITIFFIVLIYYTIMEVKISKLKELFFFLVLKRSPWTRR